jgi:cytochrome c-type biogenesis protein
MTEVSIPVAFSAGVLSFASPCVLPLVPIYLANLGGVVSLSAEAKRWSIFFHSISFVAGFTIVYTVIGASVGLIGVFFPPDLLRIIGGATIILFGILLIAALKVPWLNYWMHFNRPFWGKVGYLRSALMGVVFAFGIGLCTGAVLGGILALAMTEQTAWQGAYLLAAYSLGLGIPFIIVGLVLDRALPVVKWLRRRSTAISIFSGILLIVVGILMLTNTIAYLT